ncbi:hypothetical protein Trydic_g1770 [Trypoxylus dichotomus]
MGRFVCKYVTAYLNYGFGKSEYGRAEGYLHPVRKVAIPFGMVHIDHVGPFSYILVLVDAFTKFTLAKPTRILGSAEAIIKLREVFSEYGYPRRIISDRGLAFTSKAFASFVADHGVKHLLNAIATPRANGQCKRQNRTIVDALTAGVQHETEWGQKFPEVIWGMKQSINANTGMSPVQLLFAHGAGRLVDLAEGVQKAAQGDGET